MRDPDFALWLEQSYRTKNGSHLEPRPRSDARSRCKRVEKYEGDLDRHFAHDGMQSLLAILTYSRADEAKGILPQHSIPIDGDVANGTNSLRYAITLYKLFCLALPPIGNT
jgi:hypothetical protein